MPQATFKTSISTLRGGLAWREHRSTHVHSFRTTKGSTVDRCAWLVKTRGRRERDRQRHFRPATVCCPAAAIRSGDQTQTKARLVHCRGPRDIPCAEAISSECRER